MKTLSHLTNPLIVSLLSREKTLILLTAPSGVGKTTFCAELVTQARESGLSVGGFLCPAIFENGKKVGIDMLDIGSGQRRRLAVRSPDPGDATVGRWRMDESVLAWANEILAGLKEEHLVVMDELGPLEFERGRGVGQALQMLDDGRYCMALVVVRPELLSLAQTRWPQAKILELERTGE